MKNSFVSDFFVKTLVQLVFAIFCSIHFSCKRSPVTGSEVFSGGDTKETYYSCKTATKIRGKDLIFEVKKINNTMNQIDVSGFGAEKANFRLQKKGNQYWENHEIALRLGLKADGSKSIQVFYVAEQKTAGFENGFCNMFCGEYAVLRDGKCIALGVAKKDPVGDFLIETFLTVGSGLVKSAFVNLARSATTKGVSVKAASMMAAAEVDAVATNLDLWKIAEDVNPLRFPNTKHLSAGLRGLGSNAYQNCIGCALSVEATLRGNPALALPGKPSSVQVLSEIFESPWELVKKPVQFIDSAASQNGRRWIAFFVGDDVGHVVNIVPQNGMVWFIDGQAGLVRTADTFAAVVEANKWNRMYVLQTTK